MTGCQSKGNADPVKGEEELPKEINTNVEETLHISADEIPAFDVNSVLYENAIENKEPVVDIFYYENIYAFYGKEIKVFDFDTKEELQTITLEGLEDVNFPIYQTDLTPLTEETKNSETKSNTYVTAFTVYNNEYYVISDTTENTKTVTKILRFDNNGKLLHEYPIQIDNLAEKIVIKNDKAMILSVNIESIQEPLPYYDLTIYNFIEQTQAKVDVNKVWAVTLTDNNKAAIATVGEEGRNELLLMDIESQQIEKEMDVDIDFIMDLDYQDQKLYILTVSEVITTESDLTEPIATLLNNYVKNTSNRKIRIYEDESVILHSSNHLLLYDSKSLEQKAVDSEPYTITVLTPYDSDNTNYLFGDYINELKNKYPNINLASLDVIKTVEIYLEEYAEKVIKKLMAKDTDFDLFYMWDNDNLIKSNYYEDLSKYEQIAHNHDKMLPGIRSLMSYDNKIYGVPTSITFRGFDYDPTDVIDLGLQFPENTWTISDFYDFAVKNKEIIEKEQKPLLNFYHVLGIDTMFNTSLYVSYLQGVELSSDELASHFEKLKIMLEEELFTVNLNYKGKTIIDDSYINSLGESMLRLAPVTLNEDCGYLASIQYISLNPSSQNKDLAVELLAAFTDSEIRKKSIFQEIGSQMQFNVTPDFFEVPNIFNYYSELDQFKSHQLYRALLKKSYRDIRIQGYAEIGYLFEDFMNGKRTAQSAADEIIQRLDMIKYE
jgi:ABC-type glycerol-3-phosphate transport system substrate-binding protein